MLHPNGRHPSLERQALSIECCQPLCDSPAQDRVSTAVPLCEAHLFEVYKATNKLLTVGKKRGEYALLPMEQDMIPGPCPSCGIAGYLMVSVTEQVRCLNASCQYEAWIDEFEKLRRQLLFDAAADSNVVYYIKFRDRVKIGTTNNLSRRCAQIATVELIYGYEPGSRTLEARRHRQFAQYRTVGEWFEDNQYIRAHVNRVCSIA